MAKFSLFSIIVFLLTIISQFTYSNAVSCNAGRAGCIASCTLQNCATGYCVKDTCVCSRCDKGPIYDFKGIKRKH